MHVRVAYAVGDHGLGHASRACPIIGELLRRGASVLVVTTVRREFFEESLPSATGADSGCRSEAGGGGKALEFFEEKVDVGVYQRTSVEIDLDRTLESLREHWRLMPAKVERVAAALLAWRAQLVIFDIPALAPLVAHRIGLPAIGISNFSWEWIYGAYLSTHPEFRHFIELHTDAYRHTTLFLRLPYCADLPAFRSIPSRTVPLLGRGHRLSRTAVFARLGTGVGAADGLRVLLYSFGSHVFPIQDKVPQWRIPENWRVVWIEHDNSIPLVKHERVWAFRASTLKDRDVPYVDMLAASDVVVCKTGYGTVSEAIINGVSVLYTDRPGFLEHRYMVDALQENVDAAEVELDEVVHLDERLFSKADRITPNRKHARWSFDGAERAADYILQSLGSTNAIASLT